MEVFIDKKLLKDNETELGLKLVRELQKNRDTNMFLFLDAIRKFIDFKWEIKDGNLYINTINNNEYWYVGLPNWSEE